MEKVLKKETTLSLIKGIKSKITAHPAYGVDYAPLLCEILIDLLEASESKSRSKK